MSILLSILLLLLDLDHSHANPHKSGKLSVSSTEAYPASRGMGREG